MAVKEMSTSTPSSTILYSNTRACNLKGPFFSSSIGCHVLKLWRTRTRPKETMYWSGGILYELHIWLNWINIFYRNVGRKLSTLSVDIWMAFKDMQYPASRGCVTYPEGSIWTSQQILICQASADRGCLGNTEGYPWTQCLGSPSHIQLHYRTSSVDPCWTLREKKVQHIGDNWSKCEQINNHLCKAVLFEIIIIKSNHSTKTKLDCYIVKRNQFTCS